MTRLLYRLALLTWPTHYRRNHGAELIATAVELRNGRFSIREFASLAANGLGARHLRATNGERTIGWDGAVRLGLMLMLGQVLTEVLDTWIAGVPDYMSATWSETLTSALTLSAVGLASLIVVRGRAMAVILTALVGVAWFWGPVSMPRLDLAAYSVAVLVPAWWLARCDRAAGYRVVLALLAWVGTVVALATSTGSYWVSHDLLLVGVSVIGIGTARFDPRIVAGASVYWVMRLLISLPSLIDNHSWGTLSSRPALQALAICAFAGSCFAAGRRGIILQSPESR